MKSLPQFVPQKVCLSCDGCCRFKERDSRWRPYVTPEDSRRPARAAMVFENALADDGRLKTNMAGGVCHCVFFNRKENACGIYVSRPWECRLYPFILAQTISPDRVDQENRTAVYVHLACPFIQQEYDSPSFKAYVSILKEYFQEKAVRTWIRRNPSLAGNYSQYRDELEFLFTVKGL